MYIYNNIQHASRITADLLYLAVGFGIPCLHSMPDCYTIEVHSFGLNFRGQDGLSWGLVGAKLGQVGSLGGGLGAMLGSKIGLGSPLGVIFRPSWAQEPIKTPKGEAPEPIKTPKVRKLVSKSVQEPPWSPPTWSQNPT